MPRHANSVKQRVYVTGLLVKSVFLGLFRGLWNSLFCSCERFYLHKQMAKVLNKTLDKLFWAVDIHDLVLNIR